MITCHYPQLRLTVNLCPLLPSPAVQPRNSVRVFCSLPFFLSFTFSFIFHFRKFFNQRNNAESQSCVWNHSSHSNILDGNWTNDYNYLYTYKCINKIVQFNWNWAIDRKTCNKFLMLWGEKISGRNEEGGRVCVCVWWMTPCLAGAGGLVGWWAINGINSSSSSSITHLWRAE